MIGSGGESVRISTHPTQGKSVYFPGQGVLLAEKERRRGYQPVVQEAIMKINKAWHLFITKTFGRNLLYKLLFSHFLNSFFPFEQLQPKPRTMILALAARQPSQFP